LIPDTLPIGNRWAAIGNHAESKENTMKETFAEFCRRIDRTPRLRNEGKAHECHAILPFPESERIAAFNLSDYYVSASVSGPCLEFRPRINLSK